jgi:glycosyltransferase involved in cell wall biosynthesis
MPRFLGIKNNRVCVVSDQSFACSGVQVIELPADLEHVTASQLITNYKFKNGRLSAKFTNKPAKELKVALVGNWKIRCGIATYSEFLWGEVIKHLGDYKLFIEKSDSYIGPLNVIGKQTIAEDKVIECWKRGESLQPLVAEIKKYGPDIVWIQHEFGLWPNAGYWLSLMTQLSDYRVIVTMHSVFHHQDKTICEAAMPEIITHLQGGHDVLKVEKQITSKVHVIPHGCFPCLNPDKLWNFYKSDRTFMQFGFGFRYKGWENAIKAVAILKEKYNNVFFTGLFSESTYNQVEHHIYYNELMDLVERLNLQDHVALIRGFQSEATLDSYLRTNQATIFPYISHPSHEVFGASGAARVAMSKGLPVVTSSINHFSDLPTLKADTPEEIAQVLEKLFSSSQFKEEQVNKQLSYINENTWENVALKHIAIFERYEDL